MRARCPIMYHDGGKWRNWERYNTGQKNSVAILVGGGPSLNKIDTTKLAGPGKTVFGLNTTYPKVRPDIWIGMDDPKCYDRRLFYEPFPKIMRGNYYDKNVEGVPLLDLPSVYFASVTKFNRQDDIFYRIDRETESFMWNKNVFVVAINILLYMGFRKIYLAGVDFSLENGDYHYGENVLSKKYKDWNENLYKHLYKYTNWIASTGRMCGIDIESISPDSPINQFLPFQTLETLNKSLSLPDRGILYHCGELEEPASSIK